MNLHVRLQGKEYSFRIRLLDRYLDAGESYVSEEAAACGADLAKHYFNSFFFFDLSPSLDPEVFNTLAFRLNVVLSDRLSVEKSLAPGVKKFLLDHRDALSEHALNNKPEVKPWAALRASPGAMVNRAVYEWVLACERAELDVEAFAALNGKYFLSLMDGISNRSADILKPLALALKMHSGATNEKLVERLRLLVELETHLQATRAHIEFLAIQFAAEQLAVEVALSILESNRPPLV